MENINWGKTKPNILNLNGSNQIGTNDTSKIKWIVRPESANVAKSTYYSTADIDFEFYKQLDSNQCGPCAALNLLSIKKIAINQEVVNMRRIISRKHDRINNVNNFWFTACDIEDVLMLAKMPKDRISLIKTHNSQSTDKTDLDVASLSNHFSDLILLFNNNHWVLISNLKNQWYKIDSLYKPHVSKISELAIKNIVQKNRNDNHIGAVGVGIKKGKIKFISKAIEY